jgi:NADPH2:quinone reductase
MKALLCKAFGPVDSLVVEEVAPAQPGSTQVVVDVKAAGVNFPDGLIVQGKYQFKPAFPFSPGSEFAGVVARTGSAVTRWKPGDRVLAIPLFGAFAEEAMVEQDALVAIPPTLEFELAAAFAFTFCTSYHALKDRGELRGGETLLVLGAAGGTGLAAVELGKATGARVIAAASSEDKLELCRAHGADATINYATEDLRERVRALTAGRGVDVVFDPVGGAYSEAALRSMAWRGRHLVIGFTDGEIPRLPANLVLLKGCSVVGVFWGDYVKREPDNNRRDLDELFLLLQQGRIRPHISARYPLAGAIEAIGKVANRQAKGKIVILPEA